MASGTKTRQGQSAKNLAGSKGSSGASKRNGGDQGAKRGAAAAGKKAR
jgi:hypothetical protein